MGSWAWVAMSNPLRQIVEAAFRGIDLAKGSVAAAPPVGPGAAPPAGHFGGAGSLGTSATAPANLT